MVQTPCIVRGIGLRQGYTFSALVEILVVVEVAVIGGYSLIIAQVLGLSRFFG